LSVAISITARLQHLPKWCASRVDSYQNPRRRIYAGYHRQNQGRHAGVDHTGGENRRPIDESAIASDWAAAVPPHGPKSGRRPNGTSVLQLQPGMAAFRCATPASINMRCFRKRFGLDRVRNGPGHQRGGGGADKLSVAKGANRLELCWRRWRGTLRLTAHDPGRFILDAVVIDPFQRGKR
jgi:hypothetical protein